MAVLTESLFVPGDLQQIFSHRGKTFWHLPGFSASVSAAGYRRPCPAVRQCRRPPRPSCCSPSTRTASAARRTATSRRRGACG